MIEIKGKKIEGKGSWSFGTKQNTDAYGPPLKIDDILNVSFEFDDVFVGKIKLIGIDADDTLHFEYVRA